jgi:hypothetical protein
MNDFDFSLIDDQFDHIHESEEDDWTKAVLGEDEDVIRQLVG